MMNLILLILLLFGLLIGLKRGFILQIFHLLGYIVAFFVSTKYYSVLAPKLVLWIPYPDLPSDSAWVKFLAAFPLEKGFYNIISFAIIFFTTKIIMQIIASMLDFVAALPILNSMNRLFGALFGFLEIYLIIFIVLFILALTPIGTIQTWINESSLALLILEKTPYMSEKLISLLFLI